MREVTIKFHFTVPLEIRKKVEIKVGEELIVREKEGKIVFIKCSSLRGLARAWVHIEDTEDLWRILACQF
jgi:AbrB family looped-hinge helix DNA binding protein